MNKASLVRGISADAQSPLRLHPFFSTGNRRSTTVLDGHTLYTPKTRNSTRTHGSAPFSEEERSTTSSGHRDPCRRGSSNNKRRSSTMKSERITRCTDIVFVWSGVTRVGQRTWRCTLSHCHSQYERSFAASETGVVATDGTAGVGGGGSDSCGWWRYWLINGLDDDDDGKEASRRQSLSSKIPRCKISSTLLSSKAPLFRKSDRSDSNWRRSSKRQAYSGSSEEEPPPSSQSRVSRRRSSGLGSQVANIVLHHPFHHKKYNWS